MIKLDATPLVVDPPLEATCLKSDDALGQYGDAWLQLAQKVKDATLFMWPAFFDAWRQTLAQGVVSEVIVVHRGVQLVGVLPIMRECVWRGPAFVPRIDYASFDRDLSPGGWRIFATRQVSSVVSWRATALRPTLLADPAHFGTVIGAITRALAGMDAVDQIVLPVRENVAGAWMDGLAATGLRPWCHHLKRQVLTLNHVRPFDEIVARQNRDFRKNVRRARVRAAEAGLEYTLHLGHDQVLPQMECLARLAAESWKGQGGRPDNKAIPYQGAQQRFFEHLIADRKSGMTPVLVIGAAHGHTVAALLCMQNGRNLTGLLIFRNELHAAASPGLLGVGALIDYASAEGLLTVDLNATQDWLRFIADSSHQLVNVAAFRPTRRGRFYDVIARARRGEHSDAVI